MTRTWISRAAAASTLAAAGTAVALACGPFFSDLLTVSHRIPADGARYARGELGVVKPTFARRYLVQAYRTVGGAPPIEPDARPTEPGTDSAPSPLVRWRDLQARDLPAAAAQGLRPITTYRRGADYSSFDNCLASAFEHALAAHAERTARYGARSREMIDWVAAQAAVFQNCGGGPLVLPAPAAPGSDPRIQADRDYQTAAAYFYATQYDEAAGRFRAIAANTASPWRASGRYLAARALIRSATVPPQVKDAAARLAAAQRDLQATLADRDAAPLHASARGLLDFVAARANPVERLHELSRRLQSAPTVAPQDLVDYTWLMDVALGQTAAGGPGLDRAEVTKGDDLTDWIVAVQTGGDRARQRWQETASERWLIAALWTTPLAHPETAALVAAAARVPRTSPAFPTAAFLRVRALIQKGEVDEARAALATLPAVPGPGVDTETVNLLRAARFTVARTLDEMLANAPREILAESSFVSSTMPTDDKPAWDDDVAVVFNTRLPLERLVAAAESATLPQRLRRRVAQAALTRALVLERSEAGVRAARVLNRLAPPLRADLARYAAAATDDARERAATLLLLRTPGLSVDVIGRDDTHSYDLPEPARRFAHGLSFNWWCDRRRDAGDSASSLVTGGSGVPFPLFVSETERQATAAELEALANAGVPRVFLAAAAIEWARARPADPEAAEALARAIEGWRWSPCPSGTQVESDLPKRAFALLHRQFPGTEWARQTKYWYR